MIVGIEEMSAELAEELRSNTLVDPRTVPVRHSNLKLMSLSPAHYWHACQRKPDAGQSLAMRLGSGVHAMVLGTPVERYSARRAGKDWEAFKRDHANSTILNDREWAEAQAMSAALLRHREAMAILFEGTTIEQPIEWEYLGRKCRSIPDARAPYVLAELKTGRTAHPAMFVRDAIRMHYHCQLAFYAMAIEHATGIAPTNVYSVVIEKYAPHPVTILRLTDRVIELGRKTIRLWMEQLLACEAANVWPAYSESIVDFDAPDDETDHPIDLVIGGEDVEV